MNILGFNVMGLNGIVIGIAVVLVILIGWAFVFPYVTQDAVQFTVTDKERVTKGVGSSRRYTYLIFTDDETFENVDSIRRFKFRSSDLYGKVKIGSNYTATVYGWRVPILSKYRNIIKIEG